MAMYHNTTREFTFADGKWTFDNSFSLNRPCLLAKYIIPHILDKKVANTFIKFLELRGFGDKNADLLPMFDIITCERLFCKLIGPRITPEQGEIYLRSLHHVCGLPIMKKYMRFDEHDCSTGFLKDFIDKSCVIYWDELEIEKGSETQYNGKTSKYEERFREAIVAKTGNTFYKIRPDWLLNRVTGNLLELDMYNAKLKLAIEYNGPQHYEYPNTFHFTEQYFINQMRRDVMKARLCRERGVQLITIRMCESLDDEIRQYDDQIRKRK
jgi:hypothetical protein